MKLLTATLLISLGFIALSQTKASNRLAQKTLKSLIQSRIYARQEEGDAEGEALPENDQGDNYDWSYDNSTAPTWDDYNNTGGDYNFSDYNNETSGDNNWTSPYNYSDYGNSSDYDYGYGNSSDYDYGFGNSSDYDYGYGNSNDSGDYSFDDGNSNDSGDYSFDDGNSNDSGDYSYNDGSNSGENYDWSADNSSGDFEAKQEPSDE